MPRGRRITGVNTALHIMCRGNNKLPILANQTDKKYYYMLIHRFKWENQVDILHYCIMHNHVHLITWLNKRSNLPRLMKQINLAYYHYYSNAYSYCGHLWQGRYKSILIKSDSQALQCGKYIELNPVRAGIITNPSHYQFSSYGFYAHGKADRLLTPSPAYKSLSPDLLTRKVLYIDLVMGQNAP